MSLKPIADAQSEHCEEKMRMYQIFIDGIDKTGKDLVKSYVYYLGKARYICIARGIISMRVYAKLYNRSYKYDAACQKNVLNVLLTVDKEDWEIRCKNTNEPLTDYDKETALFEEEAQALKKKEGCDVISFNTSQMTPYEIAKCILEYADALNARAIHESMYNLEK